MKVFASIAFCLIPLLALYACLALLLKGFRKSTALLACVLGMVSFLPIQLFLIPFAHLRAHSLVSLLLLYCFRGGLIEEGVKMLLLFLLPARRTQKSVFTSYAVLFGFTLASFENAIYLLAGNPLTIRLFTAAIIHTSCSVLCGLFVLSVKKKKTQILSFLFALIFHGVYNYFADFADIRKFFAIAVILIAVFECVLRYLELGQEKQVGKEGETQKMETPKKTSLWKKIKNLFVKEVSQEPKADSLQEQTVFSQADLGNEDATLVLDEEVEAKESPVDTEKTLVGDAEEESDAALETGAETTLAQENAKEEREEEKPEEKFPTIPNIFADDFAGDEPDLGEVPDSVNIEEIIREEPKLKEEPIVSQAESSEATVLKEKSAASKIETAEESPTPAKKTSSKAKTSTSTRAAGTNKKKAEESSAAPEKKTKTTRTSATTATKGAGTSKKAATKTKAEDTTTSKSTKSTASKAKTGSGTKSKPAKKEE